MPLRNEILHFLTKGDGAVVNPSAIPTPDLPKWDGKMYVRRVSPGVINRLGEEAAEAGVSETTFCFCQLAGDETGNRIFVDGDALVLDNSPAMQPTIERFYWEARRVHGLTQANREGWRKNCESTGMSGSPSSSAVPAPPVTDSTSAAY